jgi:hypothetical protein
MEFLSQIATVVVSATTGFHHALLVPALSRPCVYVLVWSQGVSHYSKKIKAGKIADLSEVQAAPILEFESPVFEWALRTSWAQLPAVIVRLPLAKQEVAKLLTEFEKELQECGTNAGGHADIGPDNSSGLRTGGGWPFSTFACHMRSLSSWQSIFRLVLEVDGRSQSSYPLHSTFEPIGYSRSSDGFSGLTPHKDNAIVAGTTDCFGLQSVAVLSPSPKGVLRLSCFSSCVPMTPWCYREVLLQLTTRFCCTEVGLTSRGPKDRPPMRRVCGGDFLGFAAASKKSNNDLLIYIRQNTTKAIQSRIPDAPTEAASCKFSKELEAYVKEHVGKRITSLKQLEKVAAADGPRRALVRALLGNMASKDLWEALPGGPVSIAQAVWKGVHDYGDKKLLLLWISNKGSGGQTRDAREAVSQPVGDARKRLKRM